jgi:hypothetical protein
MAFSSFINKSIFGRSLGLQFLTTALSGGRKYYEYLVGPEAFRSQVSTAETTATNVDPFGVSYLPGTSAGSSAVYTIDPPVPGVSKFIIASTANGPVYLKTKNSEVILSTIGSSHTTVKASSIGGTFMLIGLTTASWGAIGITSGTSSQAGSFAVTTST